MKQLIDLFNKKYGKQYGVIDDSFSNEDTYKIYKIIKTLCSDDTEMMELLNRVKLPEPKTAKESIEKININVSGGGSSDDNKLAYIISEETILTIPASDVQTLISNEVIDIPFGGTFDANKVYYAEYNGKEYKSISISDDGKGLYFTSDNFYIELEVGYDLNWNDDDTKTIVSLYTPNDVTEALDIVIKTKETQYLNPYFLDPNIKGIESISSSGVIGKTGSNSMALGEYSQATGDNSLAVGSGAKALGDYSHAEGSYTTASGHTSHVEGSFSRASGTVSHAECDQTLASGNSSHAEGVKTTSLGTGSHAEGISISTSTSVIHDLSSSTSNDDILTAWNNKQFSLAKGDSSHVEGINNLALGDYSHVEGSYSIGIGVASHVEGLGSRAEGGYSHAEGNGTTAMGMCSHAEGDSTTASGDDSHAEGRGTKASSENQHVQGKYNIEDTENKYAHIVGNGKYNYNTEEEVRSNAHTLDWNGNGWFAGKLTQEGTPTEDKDLATKKYVDDKTASIDTTINNTLPSNGLLTLTTDKIQTTTLAVPTDITLPTVTGYTEIHLFFEGSEGVTITTGTTTVRWKTSPTISTGNLYEIVFTYINDTIGWIGDCSSYTA